MEYIKNIILDLGGVLFDLSYEKTIEEFGKLGISDAFSKANQIDVFDKIEEGKISQSEFFDSINKISFCFIFTNISIFSYTFNST